MAPRPYRPYVSRLEGRQRSRWRAGLAWGTLLGALLLSWMVMTGVTGAIDARILLAFRHADDLSQPIGPAWVETALFDITALGGRSVLGLLVLAVGGFLVLQARFHDALMLFVAAVTGDLANTVLKWLFSRPRPEVVPHLRDVQSLSFPSGHAMDSAIVYLTMAAMLAHADRRATRVYVMGVAVLLTFIVGVSRIYLGVHYPSDVLAGWMFGIAWASFCWSVSQRLGI